MAALLRRNLLCCANALGDGNVAQPRCSVARGRDACSCTWLLNRRPSCVLDALLLQEEEEPLRHGVCQLLGATSAGNLQHALEVAGMLEGITTCYPQGCANSRPPVRMVLEVVANLRGST